MYRELCICSYNAPPCPRFSLRIAPENSSSLLNLRLKFSSLGFFSAYIHETVKELFGSAEELLARHGRSSQWTATRVFCVFRQANLETPHSTICLKQHLLFQRPQRLARHWNIDLIWQNVKMISLRKGTWSACSSHMYLGGSFMKS